MSKDRTPPGQAPARPTDAPASRPTGEAAARKARSAEALRDNLRRRKQQTAARRPGGATED
jgi:hypothetical protein